MHAVYRQGAGVPGNVQCKARELVSLVVDSVQLWGWCPRYFTVYTARGWCPRYFTVYNQGHGVPGNLLCTARGLGYQVLYSVQPGGWSPRYSTVYTDRGLVSQVMDNVHCTTRGMES